MNRIARPNPAKAQQAVDQWNANHPVGTKVEVRLEGGTVKFCVSVTKTVWHDASEIWNGNRSQLFDHLLRDFVTTKAKP